MLLDHFHPPLSTSRHWTGFHGMWSARIASDLNRRLPEGWYAEPTVHWRVEVDVAALEETTSPVGATHGESSPPLWQPPEPVRTIEFGTDSDVVEVQVYYDSAEFPLVGAIELVSPRNKDRPESREAFTCKCEALLHEAVGLMIVDVVTNHRANLHAELMARIGNQETSEAALYVSAYRRLSQESHSRLAVWFERLEVGERFPSMPLFLRDGPCIEVDLAATYLETCRDLRIANPSATK